jgi:ATP-dependent Clp protease ATP-binding subunit ClpA
MYKRFGRFWKRTLFSNRPSLTNTTAEERKHEFLTPVHVIQALVTRAVKPVFELLQNAGASTENVRAKLERTLGDM